MHFKGWDPEVGCLLFPVRADHFGKIGCSRKVRIGLKLNALNSYSHFPERKIDCGISFSRNDLELSHDQASRRRIPCNLAYLTEKDEAFPPPVKGVPAGGARGGPGL